MIEVKMSYFWVVIDEECHNCQKKKILTKKPYPWSNLVSLLVARYFFLNIGWCEEEKTNVVFLKYLFQKGFFRFLPSHKKKYKYKYKHVFFLGFSPFLSVRVSILLPPYVERFSVSVCKICNMLNYELSSKRHSFDFQKPVKIL